MLALTAIIQDIQRPSIETVKQASIFSSATLCEAAGNTGILPTGLKPLDRRMKICGPVVTVASPPVDNIMLHEALLVVQEGDVIVATVSNHFEAGYWGDIMTVAAKERGVQGLVIDGCVRDSADIITMNFPTFSRGLCVHGTGKQGGGTINHPIRIGAAHIYPGDLIVGDCDGIVVIPRENIEAVVTKAIEREEKEKEIREKLRKGKSTIEIYGWNTSLNT